jgi:hypothetical protein
MLEGFREAPSEQLELRDKDNASSGGAALPAATTAANAAATTTTTTATTASTTTLRMPSSRPPSLVLLLRGSSSRCRRRQRPRRPAPPCRAARSATAPPTTRQSALSLVVAIVAILAGLLASPLAAVSAQQPQEQPPLLRRRRRRQQIDLNFVKTERPYVPGGNVTHSNSTGSNGTAASWAPTPVPDWSSLFSRPPTQPPSRYPTHGPTDSPSADPTISPSEEPTNNPPPPPPPSAEPTTTSPSIEPTPSPTTTAPATATAEPTPSGEPSLEPTQERENNNNGDNDNDDEEERDDDEAGGTEEEPTPSPTSATGAPVAAAPTAAPTTTITGTPTPTRYEALEGSTPGPTIKHNQLVEEDTSMAPTRNDDGRSTAEQNVSLVLVERTVPFQFNATLTRSNNSNNGDDESQTQLLKRLDSIWEAYILERLQASFRNDDAAYVQKVQLVLQQLNPPTGFGSAGQTKEQRKSGPGQDPKRILRLKRFLQQSGAASDSTSTTVRAEGTAVFQADQDRPVNTLTDQTQSNLNPILTKESLQQAIVLSEDTNDSTEPAWSVQSVQAAYPASTTSSSASMPTTVELVFGFFLLFLAASALMYTCYMLIQRCRKQRKLAKQERDQQAMGHSRDPALRKGSIVAKVPPQQSSRSTAPAPAGPALLSPTIVPSSRTRSPLRINSLPTSTLPDSTDDDDDLDFYPGLGKSTETDTTNNNQQQSQQGDNGDNDDEESEFGFQLRQAAYVDQAAWDEYQRRKQLLAKEASMFQPTAGSAGAGVLLPPVMTLRRGVYDDDFIDGGGGDSKAGSVVHEGLEVDELGRPVVASLDRVRSFPYGDEKDDMLFVMDDDIDPDHEETAVISPAAARAAAAAAMARSSYDDDDGDDPAVQSREVRSSMNRPLRSLRAFTSRLRGVDAALQDAVEWTPTGMALRSPPKSPLEGDDPNFEPYGDEHKIMTLQESWEQDDPVPPIKPAAFSFLYPLQRQHVSDSTKSTTDTQQSSSTGVQAAAVVRASPTGSTWSTGAAVHDGPRDFPTLDRRELLDKPLPSHDEEDRNEDDDDDDDDDDNAGTERMLREVAMINAYVKRYEQQKRE